MSSITSYQSISSNRQIISLLKVHLQRVLDIFIKILGSYYISVKDIKSVIFDYLNNKENFTDKDVYDTLRIKLKDIGSFPKLDSNSIFYQYTSIRANKRVEDISSFYNNKTDSYLDLGGGDGSITLAIASHYKVEKAICADIDNWYDTHDKKYDIDYVSLNENEQLPFNDEEFSLITCFQSLHHMKNLDSRLKDIKRIIKRGGYLIIREHDCCDDNMKMLIDIEHCIFELVLKEYNQQFVNEYYADYKSKYQWSDIFCSLGFKYIHTKYPQRYGKNNPTRYYYAMYKKL